MKVIIFGVKDIAQLAHYYLENDTPDTVVSAFCVNEEYMPENREFCGRPVYPFETIETVLPPGEYKFFAPMTGSQMSTLREKVYIEAKAKGYEFISYISTKATNFASKIGENCFILEDNTIQPFVEIGNNVVLWSGNHIGHHSVIKDHAFFTSQVVLSGHCTVNSYAWFGVNSTVRDGCEVAEGTCLSMGACLTKSKTDPWSLYMGMPAKKKDGVDPRKII